HAEEGREKAVGRKQQAESRKQKADYLVPTAFCSLLIRSLSRQGPDPHPCPLPGEREVKPGRGQTPGATAAESQSPSDAPRRWWPRCRCDSRRAHRCIGAGARTNQSDDHRPPPE